MIKTLGRPRSDLLMELLEIIDDALEKGKQGLLRSIELTDVVVDAQSVLDHCLIRDSILQRKYEKFTHQTIWTTPRLDGFSLPQDVANMLNPYRQFAVETLENEGKIVPQEQKFILKGLPFTGRKLIREIFNCATRSIDIQDNYVHGVSIYDIEILNILEPYADSKSPIKLRVLTSQVSNAFKSDLKLFNSQFSNKIEFRTHNNCHGRFVIIDNNTVFQIGSSLKDLGKKADFINEITVQTERNNVIKNFEDWWSTGSSV